MRYSTPEEGSCPSCCSMPPAAVAHNDERRLAAELERLGLGPVEHEVVPDDRELIEGRLRWWSDRGGCALVVTSGGTGFSPDNVTP